MSQISEPLALQGCWQTSPKEAEKGSDGPIFFSTAPAEAGRQAAPSKLRTQDPQLAASPIFQLLSAPALLGFISPSPQPCAAVISTPSPRCRSLNPLAAIKFNYVSSADVPRRSCQRVYGTAAVRGQHPSSPPVVSWRRSSLPVAVWPPRESEPRALRGCWDLPDISPCFAINILVATACPERSAVFIPEMPRFCIFLAVHPGGGTHFAGSLVHGNLYPS